MIPPPRATGPTRSVALLYLTRTVRGFGLGGLSVVLAIVLAQAGYPPVLVGLWVGLGLGGASLWSWGAPHMERRLGRRATFLLASAALSVGGLMLFLAPGSAVLVVGALLLGGVVASGSDLGALPTLEQATLGGLSSAQERTRRFVEYNLLGYVGLAFGALAAAPVSSVSLLPGLGGGPHDGVLLLYAALGVCLIPAYLALQLPPSTGTPASAPLLSAESKRHVLWLSGLFSVDAFGGGLVANSLVAYWFEIRFHPSAFLLGSIFFLSSLAAGLSLLLALPVARRLGLVRTMVYSHLPSSVLLALVPFVPSLLAASSVWVARASLSQMDVPTRQSFVQALVAPGERTAAAGYTTAARSSTVLGGPLTGLFLGLGGGYLAGPFVLAGSVKVAYDLAIFRRFRHVVPPEEEAGRRGAG
jgi:MFS family permease